MTSNPATLIREGFEGWNRGDLDSVLDRLDPDVRIRLSGAFAGLGPEYRGHQGYRKFWQEFRDMWDTLEVQPEEIETVDGLVFSTVLFRGKARDGIEVEQHFYFVFELTDDGTQVTAYRAFSDREDANSVVQEALSKGRLAV